VDAAILVAKRFTGAVINAIDQPCSRSILLLDKEAKMKSLIGNLKKTRIRKDAGFFMPAWQIRRS